MTPPREVRRTLRIADPDGLHARPCAEIARAAARLRCRIVFVHDGREADARSVLELLSLGVLRSAEVELRVSGEDAEPCAAAFIRALEATGTI